jgi:hypothetical protein
MLWIVKVLGKPEVAALNIEAITRASTCRRWHLTTSARLFQPPHYLMSNPMRGEDSCMQALNSQNRWLCERCWAVYTCNITWRVGWMAGFKDLSSRNRQ